MMIMLILCPYRYCWLAVRSSLPLNRPTQRLNMVAPNALPKFLEVDIIPDATPPELGGTLPITMLVHGA